MHLTLKGSEDNGSREMTYQTEKNDLVVGSLDFSIELHVNYLNHCSYKCLCPESFAFLHFAIISYY